MNKHIFQLTVIYSLAVITGAFAFVYISNGINALAAPQTTGQGVQPAYSTTLLQPAANVVTNENPVSQGDAYSLLEGQVETTSFYQGQ